MASSGPSSGSKRQRLTDRDSNAQGSTQTQPRGSQVNVKDMYDPDQDIEERRRLRKGLRDLSKELNGAVWFLSLSFLSTWMKFFSIFLTLTVDSADSRAEYLKAGNDGLMRTVRKANEYFGYVKQTAEAAIDSRLLVTAADLSHKKTAQLALGDTNSGIDVDEFVSKCVSYMRRGEQSQEMPTSTQRRRRRTNGRGDGDDSDEDEGDAMNWDWLGRSACLRHNARPAVSGFLLGPLSVQKRTRQPTQRRAREEIDRSRAVAPQELQAKDLDRQETQDLTQMCKIINKLLSDTQMKAQGLVERDLSPVPQEELTDELVQETMDKYNISDDGGVPLFCFCLNPKSFGQSVENLFYVSFLIRDGTVGISLDGRGLPTLRKCFSFSFSFSFLFSFSFWNRKVEPATNVGKRATDHSEPYGVRDAREKGIQKHQTVFSLDFETWHDLIDAYGIEDSVIAHREEPAQSSGGGWHR